MNNSLFRFICFLCPYTYYAKSVRVVLLHYKLTVHRESKLPPYRILISSFSNCFRLLFINPSAPPTSSSRFGFFPILVTLLLFLLCLLMMEQKRKSIKLTTSIETRFSVQNPEKPRFMQSLADSGLNMFSKQTFRTRQRSGTHTVTLPCSRNEWAINT